MENERIELKCIFGFICVIFAGALCSPLLILFSKSLIGASGGLGLENYVSVLHNEKFLISLQHSFVVSGLEALITVILAFLLAYGLHYTRLPKWFKSVVQVLIILPMFLPTLTYGFAVIYSFGRQGLITQLAGHQLFSIYGFGGLLLSYIIYTLPPAFILLNNAFKYVDKHFIVVSRIMGDSFFRTFYVTSIRPMIGTIAAAFIVSFFLSFTDFGIPASIGGRYSVVATELYMIMMGAVPDFQSGSAIAVIMLLPSLAAVGLLQFSERFNFRYNKINTLEIASDTIRDAVFALFCILIINCILAVFAIMFIVPFIKSWPYQVVFTTETLQRILGDSSIKTVYIQSVMVAAATAFIGTVLAYMAALVNARSHLSGWCKMLMDVFAMMTNTVPGMVIGVAFLFTFTGTSLQNTFLLIILLNSVREFTTPYLMIQASLSKMNMSWETTGILMGDSWIKTVFRVIIPNTMSTVFQMLSYIFVQALVTISAIVFITGARTMVMTTKIVQAQYFEKYDEVFVLSLLIFLTNIFVKAFFDYLANHDDIVLHIKGKFRKFSGKSFSTEKIGHLQKQAEVSENTVKNV
ncbi:MAG: ABC transporter permease subunit [Megasphaera sp.]|jgi:iron(III) transport system permease protein|nr:ABC transporter permease subunit [Megasphaera sp.]